MKNFFIRIKTGAARLIPTKRRLIQLYAALLFNANLKGFATGKIYQGNLKNACIPGLNCYSCPGASGACPLGALQNSLAASPARAPYYVFGILMLYGLLLGRTICGWLCPFGLVQELLYKIKTPKLKKGRVTRVLSYLKYVILAIFVVGLPLIYAFRDLPLPAFCKYICPAGTLGGAIGLLIHPDNANLFGMLGSLFTWKFAVLVAFVLASIFIYRFFCRFFCPLGAIYGLFNRISFLGVKVDQPTCTNCGLCVSHCKMDIRRVGDHECIACGDCIGVCPTKAITWRGSKFFLAPNAVGDDPAARAAAEKKVARRKKITQIVAAVTMVAVLGGALVYYNVFDKTSPPVGSEVGDTCPTVELPLLNAEGSFSLAENGDRVTVINFWGTWCTPCVAELPHFDEIATEYADRVNVVAIHSYAGKSLAPQFIETNYPDTKILFTEDGEDEAYCLQLGGGQAWPMTVIVDAEGVITAKQIGALSYEELKALVDQALGA